jgi:hypothetical protein
MKKSCETLLARALLATTVIAGILVCHNAARCALDPIVCTNKTCWNLKYYYDCALNNGVALDVDECLTCSARGRCTAGGNPNNCTQTINPLHYAITNVNNYCFPCNIAPANGTLEASGNYMGPYKAFGNQHLCP